MTAVRACFRHRELVIATVEAVGGTAGSEVRYEQVVVGSYALDLHSEGITGEAGGLEVDLYLLLLLLVVIVARADVPADGYGLEKGVLRLKSVIWSSFCALFCTRDRDGQPQ